MPAATTSGECRHINGLGEISDDFDVFLLDAFGVLNVGERPIAGANEQVAKLQRAGKLVMVVSNAASYPKRIMAERLGALGFTFPDDNLLSSRELLVEHIRQHSKPRYGVMLPRTYGLEELPNHEIEFLEDDIGAYSRAEAFLLLGSGEWTDERQKLLTEALLGKARPVYVGNPDIVAPRETGLTKEPGYYAHCLADTVGIAPLFFGKPFENTFQAALAKVPAQTPKSRIVMVGDTLQTDVLGASAAGIASVLVTGHGSLKDLDLDEAMALSGIRPDYVTTSV